jgi:hypothetical protein
MTEPKIVVGGRYLLRRLYSYACEEHTIREVSPSGKRAKTEDTWINLDDYIVEEQLPAVASEKRND